MRWRATVVWRARSGAVRNSCSVSEMVHNRSEICDAPSNSYVVCDVARIGCVDWERASNSCFVRDVARERFYGARKQPDEDMADVQDFLLEELSDIPHVNDSARRAFHPWTKMTVMWQQLKNIAQILERLGREKEESSQTLAAAEKYEVMDKASDSVRA
ncbi:unnamed protein product [Toxocara canis]|uniref:Syntaxin-6_N domain-containing protein n=1 Tax=Toxocara canis TaxID=6265 RepID=A0A183UHM3_TOXCA|nr:unnamed protein product [Toxocara canis]